MAQEQETAAAKIPPAELMEVMIRFGLVAFLVVVCVRIFQPFLGLVLWGLILAVVLYPLQQKLARRFGGREGRAATVLVVVSILLIGIPSAMLAGSFANFVHDAHAAVQAGTLSIDPPKPEVAEWPLIGQKVFEVWDLAARFITFNSLWIRVTFVLIQYLIQQLLLFLSLKVFQGYAPFNAGIFLQIVLQAILTFAVAWIIFVSLERLEEKFWGENRLF